MSRADISDTAAAAAATAANVCPAVRMMLDENNNNIQTTVRPDQGVQRGRSDARSPLRHNFQ